MLYRDLRQAARHVALGGSSTFYRFADRIEPALRTSRVQFLVFHEIPPGGEKSFNHLIGILARTHRFVSYSDAVNQILMGQIHYPAIAISFDDGLLSCLRAAEILWESGISACFFLCPTGLDAASGGVRSFALDYAFNRPGFSHGVMRRRSPGLGMRWGRTP